ncbi:MAG: hypothetical protein LBC67_00335 [Spirochaetales bacterium]|jgi:hypothetical protein|nr:hypothetical protein [Spirochaetales bacterium]
MKTKLRKKPRLTAGLLSAIALMGLAALTFTACLEESWESFTAFDSEELRPPRLGKVVGTEGGILEAHFDKAAWIDAGSLALYPGLVVTGVEDGVPVVKIHLQEGGQPGHRYTLEASVRDERGNTCSFLYHFYGHNPRIPRMVINEVALGSPTTRSYTFVEIALLTAGNMGGVNIFQGTKSHADKSFMFPPFEVAGGDYILVHFNTIEAEGEVNETTDKTSASGKGASATAWDFWLTASGNLSKDNNVISLYTNPEGELIDALVYTTRRYEAGMKYNGFGTSLMQNKVNEVISEAGWRTGGAEPFPEDAFDQTGATTVSRPICRDSLSRDTNSAADWHVVPTGSQTPGAANSNEVYER